MIANVIHVLCALTSALCAVLLFRSWRRTRGRLLFWGALCFIGLALNNLLLVIDLRIDRVDLAGIRMLPALMGVALLLYGLIRNEA
jgi:drug/metabolite transporter superfamily protein YnfA